MNVRKRSFMFVSNLNVKASLEAGAGSLGMNNDIDFDMPGSNYVNMEGTKSTSDPNDGTGYSNKFMHYLIASASSDAQQ